MLDYRRANRRCTKSAVFRWRFSSSSPSSRPAAQNTVLRTYYYFSYPIYSLFEGYNWNYRGLKQKNLFPKSAMRLWKRDELNPRYHSAWRLAPPTLSLCNGRTRPNLISKILCRSLGGSGRSYILSAVSARTKRRLSAQASFQDFYPVIAFFMDFVYFTIFFNGLSRKNNPLSFIYKGIY